jgi:hypothetical protein
MERRGLYYEMAERQRQGFGNLSAHGALTH